MEPSSLKQVIQLFARLGITAFGGPAAHIAMMRNEVVAKKQWMTDADFLDLVGATSLIPGPNSTELALHIGNEKAGYKGLLSAGLFFILPAVLITGCMASLYVQYGALPAVQPFLYGIQPAIIAVIASAVLPMAKAAAKNYSLIILGILCLILSLYGINEIIILFGAGILYMLYAGRFAHTLSFFPPAVLWAGQHISNSGLFFTFLKIGAVLYGSGYVLFAFIDTELVATGVLTPQQLLDAIAVGQFTPGPVFSSVTFVGYVVNGPFGAVMATAGVFLPSFVFVALLKPILKYLKGSVNFTHFLTAINMASIAVIAAVCVHMTQQSIKDRATAGILLCSLVVLILFPKINSALIIILGALAGYLLTL